VVNADPSVFRTKNPGADPPAGSEGAGLERITSVGFMSGFSLFHPLNFKVSIDGLSLIKKKIKFSSYIRKFRMEQLQSHI
jgi:hypothetical protein